MEHPRIKNVIVLQTVLDEIKLKSLPIYNRVRAIIENKTRCFYVFLNEHHRYSQFFNNNNSNCY